MHHRIESLTICMLLSNLIHTQHCTYFQDNKEQHLRNVHSSQHQWSWHSRSVLIQNRNSSVNPTKFGWGLRQQKICYRENVTLLLLWNHDWKIMLHSPGATSTGTNISIVEISTSKPKLITSNPRLWWSKVIVTHCTPLSTVVDL